LVGGDGVVWDIDRHVAVERSDEDDRDYRLAFPPLRDGPGPCGCMTTIPTDGLGWRLADRRRRVPPLPPDGDVAGWRVLPGGQGLELTLHERHRSGVVGRWLAGLHPAFAGRGRDEERHSSVVLGLDTAEVLATFPDGHSAERLSADGRTLFAATQRRDRPEQLMVWDVPQRRPYRLFVAFAVGWAVLILGVSTLTGRMRCLTRSP
jgi:hypothetical protein